MVKTKSEQVKRELAGIFLIGLGVGMIIGSLIMLMFWGA